MRITTNMFDQIDYILYFTIATTIACTHAALPYDNSLYYNQDYSDSGRGGNGYAQLYNEPYNDGQYPNYYDVGGYGREYSTGGEYIRSGYGGGYRARRPHVDLLSIKGNAGYHYDFKGPVPVAITSQKTLEVLPVHVHQDHNEQQVIDVSPSEMPVKIVFNSRSSPVYVHQNHIPGGPGEVQATHSEEEPHKVFHEVRRPVIQEVREIISPYRKVIQEILPVEEKIQTIVAKNDNYNGQARNQLSPASFQDYKTQTYEEETKTVVSTTRKDNKNDEEPINSFFLRARVPLIDSGLGVTSSGTSRSYKIRRLRDDDRKTKSSKQNE